jgi:hypothetical protein
MAELQINTDTSDGAEIQTPDTSVEDKARAQGWRPKEEFHGDDDDFVDAKEFLQRAPLFEKIESQSRQLKELNKAFTALKTHYTKVNEAAYERALNSLKVQRQAAISEGDGIKFEQVDTQIKQTEKAKQELQQEVNAPENNAPDPQEFVAWKSRNGWYERDEDLRTFADAYGIKLAKQGLPADEVLTSVAKKVKQEFPHKFISKNKSDAPDVGVSGGGRSTRNSEPSIEGMTDEERSIMKTLVKGGHVTQEQYIKDWKAVNAKGRR